MVVVVGWVGWGLLLGGGWRRIDPWRREGRRLAGGGSGSGGVVAGVLALCRGARGGGDVGVGWGVGWGGGVSGGWVWTWVRARKAEVGHGWGRVSRGGARGCERAGGGRGGGAEDEGRKGVAGVVDGGVAV